MTDVILAAAEAIRKADLAIACTGAGISVESGIPDFRGPGGLWERYPVEEFVTIDAFMRDPAKVWRLWAELGHMMDDVEPNPAHRALASLEASGHLHAVVTQNIDNLHQDAGSKHVIEFHGNAQTMVCLECGTKQPLDLIPDSPLPPRCPCSGVMKPDIVMFGEMIPPHALAESDRLARECGCIIVVGTSATVYPAAQLPFTAKSVEAHVIEVNISPTDFTHSITDSFLQGPAGEMLPRLAEAVSG